MAINKIQAERRGRRAEQGAAWLLRLKGYRILGRRVKTPVGEIDLVARRGPVVAIVEVKARPDMTAGLEAVTSTARRRIARAAAHYLARTDMAAETVRFDLVVMRPRRLPRHLPDAWRLDI